MQRTTLMLMIGCLTSAAMAQQPDTAHPASEKTPEGMMVPMLTDAHMRSRTPMGQGELVFNKTERGFYFFDGTDWQALLHAEPAMDGTGVLWVQQRLGSGQGGNGILKLSSGTTGFWDLTGNATTDPAVNFIGTTDAQPLHFRAGNATAGQIGAQTNAMVAFGLLSGAANTTGTGNTFIGAQAGLNTTSGGGNTAIGNSAGRANTTGQASVFLGNGAGFNSTGSFNAFLGANTGTNVTTGANNTFVGHNSGFSTTTGGGNVCLGANAGQTALLDNNNTLLGSNADIFVAGITNSTAIGNHATVSASNSLVLGSVAGTNGATSNVNVGIGVINPAERLHVVGNIRMVDGNQGIGKVLTSDGNGTGTWQVLPAASPDWGRTGNASTNPTTDFIGTTDAVAFNIRTANSNRIHVSSAGKVGIGNTAASTTLQVNGGFSIESAAPLSLGGGTSTITVGDKSFIRAQALLSSTALVLTDGVTIGQILLIQNSGGTAAQNLTIADNATTTNCNLVSARTIGPSDVITLLWNGTDWLEVAFANN